MPTEPDPIGADLRHKRACQRVPAGSVCVICGRGEPAGLREAKRSLLEQHHLAGRENDGKLTVVLCLYCHRLQTVRQQTVGIALDPDADRTAVERVIALLRGLALFFQSLGLACVEWADRLAAHVARLDAHSPEWRANEIGMAGGKPLAALICVVAPRREDRPGALGSPRVVQGWLGPQR
jgi:hypothetical protein